MNNIKDIYSYTDSAKAGLPFFSSMVRAGHPTSGEWDPEKEVDLNKLLIKNPEATFFVIAGGSSLEYAGIHDGDLLIVDRSLDPVNGDMVISIENGELTIVPVSKKLKEADIWGVVVYVVHKL